MAGSQLRPHPETPRHNTFALLREMFENPDDDATKRLKSIGQLHACPWLFFGSLPKILVNITVYPRFNIVCDVLRVFKDPNDAINRHCTLSDSCIIG